MAASDRIDDRDDELTPEERAGQQKKLEQARALLAWVQAQGLQWNEASTNDLVHPEDKDLSAWRDPHTEELLLSPKLGELLKQDFRRSQGSDPTSGQKLR